MSDSSAATVRVLETDRNLHGQKPKSELVTDELHSTILRLQSRSTKLYVAIVIAIIFGVALTIFAGFFSSFDTVPLWWRLDAER
jgi:hypothetical protein